MSVYMRAALADWHEPPFEELAAFIADTSPFRVHAADSRGWAEFEALNQHGETVLAVDPWAGADAREEFQELEEFLDDLDGPAEARGAVRAHLRAASAVVGMQVLMSAYDESVAAANAIIRGPATADCAPCSRLFYRPHGALRPPCREARGIPRG